MAMLYHPRKESFIGKEDCVRDVSIYRIRQCGMLILTTNLLRSDSEVFIDNYFGTHSLLEAVATDKSVLSFLDADSDEIKICKYTFRLCITTAYMLAAFDKATILQKCRS